MRTVWVGSSLPPHSIAFISSSPKAWPTRARTSSGRSASRCASSSRIRCPDSRWHGTSSSTQSGRAEITSIGRSSGPASSAERTTSSSCSGSIGLAR